MVFLLFSGMMIFLKDGDGQQTAENFSERDLGSFCVGVNIHGLYQGLPGILADAGFQGIRSDVIWREISKPDAAVDTGSPAFGSYLNFLKAPPGVNEPIAILEYGNPLFDQGGYPVSEAARTAFVHYALAVADRLQTRNRWFEVWNEWDDLGIGGIPKSAGRGEPEAYAELLAQVYPAIKQNAPDSVVLGGALWGIGERSHFLDRLITAGALANMDGLVVHPYLFDEKGEERLPEIGFAKKFATLFQELSHAEAGKKLPVYVTEIGWPTLAAHNGVSLEEQANLTARTLFWLAMQPRIHGVWLYELRDGPGTSDDIEAHFGLISRAGAAKPAYYTVKDVIGLLHAAKSITRVDNASGGSLMSVKLKAEDNSETWILWSIHPEDYWKVTMRFSNGEKPTIRHLSISKEKTVPQPLKDDTLMVNEDPVVLENGGEEVTLISCNPSPG